MTHKIIVEILGETKNIEIPFVGQPGRSSLRDFKEECSRILSSGLHIQKQKGKLGSRFNTLKLTYEWIPPHRIKRCFLTLEK